MIQTEMDFSRVHISYKLDSTEGGVHVEEAHAARCQFHLAQLAGDRPGEGPPLVPEQFAFDQAFGEGAAVDLDEGAVSARAQPVHGRVATPLPVPVSPEINRDLYT